MSNSSVPMLPEQIPNPVELQLYMHNWYRRDYDAAEFFFAEMKRGHAIGATSVAEWRAIECACNCAKQALEAEKRGASDPYDDYYREMYLDHLQMARDGVRYAETSEEKEAAARRLQKLLDQGGY